MLPPLSNLVGSVYKLGAIIADVVLIHYMFLIYNNTPDDDVGCLSVKTAYIHQTTIDDNIQACF